MLRKRQRELLAWILGQQVREAQVNFLKKLIVASGDFPDLRVTFLCAGDIHFVERLEQWPRVPCDFLTLVLDEPAVARLEWLRGEFAEARSRADTVQLMRERRRLLFDTMRLLETVAERGAEARADFRRCGSAASLQRLHDRLLASPRSHRTKAALTDHLAALRFPEPPIASDDRFQAIRNRAELMQEANAMRNCVVVRAVEVMSGMCAIYRVDVEGERGTLQISVGRKGNPVAIEEVKLAGNTEPSEAAWSAVRQWLEEGQEAWGRRHAGR